MEEKVSSDASVNVYENKVDIDESNNLKEIEKQKQIIEELQNEIKQLKEEQHSKKHKKSTNDSMQIGFDSLEKDSFIKEISKIDILGLNPMEAMNRLYKLVSDSKKLSN